MKQQIGKLDAIPSKRLFLSIIADYDLNKSICELIDNGFDVWTRGGRRGSINIQVWLDPDQGTIRVEDNAGGLPRRELRYIVGPGQTGTSPTDETIGIFGVGTKRAVVALARDVTIRTRYGSGDTYQVEFDDAWLDDEEWELPLFRVDNIEAGTTQVELQKLRVKLSAEAVDHLNKHLGAVYANFIIKSGVTLKLNGRTIKERFFDDWSYPPGYEPHRYTGQLPLPNERPVQVEVVAGLSSESSPASGEYGVYFYCNDRLVAPAMKTFEVGFTRGQAGLPHPKIALTKVIVSLRGDARAMPWNSSKSDINTKSHVFLALHGWLVKVVADFAQVSRIWMGDWPEKVFAHKSGDIVNIPITDFPTARSSFLPDPPKSRPRWPERVAERNRRTAKQKPWTKGLYEGFVAANAVAKLPLEQSHWLAFSLLELTLTSAFKAYLQNEAQSLISENRLKIVLSRVPRVTQILKNRIPLPSDIWSEVESMARRHEELMYSRGAPILGDEELANAQSTVRRVLNKLYKIKFNV